MSFQENLIRARKARGMTQEELADRSELSKGFISQIERELTSPSIATLMDILECLGTNLKDFFSDASEEKLVFTSEDYFVKEDDASFTTWLVPSAQKNAMEPIEVRIKGGASTAVDDPHEGEEFGFVLSGKIFVCVGQTKKKCKKGDSFYFKSEKVHFLKNVGAKTAKILWVSSPPNF